MMMGAREAQDAFAFFAFALNWRSDDRTISCARHHLPLPNVPNRPFPSRSRLLRCPLPPLPFRHHHLLVPLLSLSLSLLTALLSHCHFHDCLPSRRSLPLPHYIPSLHHYHFHYHHHLLLLHHYYHRRYRYVPCLLSRSLVLPRVSRASFDETRGLLQTPQP